MVCNFSFVTPYSVVSFAAVSRDVTQRLQCAISHNFQSEFVCLASNFNTKVKCVVFSSCSDCEPFVGPAVALLNSHMGDFDTTEVQFSTLTSSLFVCFLRAHTSTFTRIIIFALEKFSYHS